MSKKNNFVIKIIIAIMIIFAILSINNICIGAEDIRTGDYNPYNHSQDMDRDVQTAIGTTVGAIRLIGSVVSLIALAIIGVKYMVSSADGKAEYKNTMIPYLIGAILVFAGSNIVSIIYNIANDFNKI